ncbi:hypothetical protein QQS21_005513 [Conoideocrella luteorostrata]|uniref:Uncharacterized protein n=1 Tax=Conoideocrella luteorostrata TaxID=1105319 RepID=A0AAJ0FYZ3_9HYPO|nr:hypothetical protein QQS21_005513 [Conoideocrella luteorostrata]
MKVTQILSSATLMVSFVSGAAVSVEKRGASVGFENSAFAVRAAPAPVSGDANLNDVMDRWSKLFVTLTGIDSNAVSTARSAVAKQVKAAQDHLASGNTDINGLMRDSFAVARNQASSTDFNKLAATGISKAKSFLNGQNLNSYAQGLYDHANTLMSGSALNLRSVSDEVKHTRNVFARAFSNPLDFLTNAGKTVASYLQGNDLNKVAQSYLTTAASTLGAMDLNSMAPKIATGATKTLETFNWDSLANKGLQMASEYLA